MTVMHLVGARANLVKVSPVMRALGERGVEQTLVLSGKHYDDGMSAALLRELELPAPALNLGVTSGSPAEQTAQVLVAVEKCLIERRPDLLMVYADETSSLAGALAASKLGIPVGHVEAGLRCRDLANPREINRIMTDRLSRWLYTPSADADENLLAEGCDPAHVKRVGSVTIDTLVRLLPRTNPEPTLRALGLINGSGPKPFALVTLHRTCNVEDVRMLERILEALADIAADLPVLFPAHPRTRARMNEEQLRFSGLLVTEPLTYLQFIGLQWHAKVVITDSGGIQEESSYLGVPCLTLLDNTARPVTVHSGTNLVVGRNPECLRSEVRKVLAGQGKRGSVPSLWDGHAADRIAEHVVENAGVVVSR